MMLKRSLNLLGQSIGELILLGIIILNIIDFLEVISPDWDYVKKIISFAALGYLIYKANLSSLFFGVRNKIHDLMILFAYFMLSFKNILGNSVSAIEQLTLKGISYWGTIVPVERAAGSVINITSSINGIDLSDVKSLPLSSSLGSLARMFTIIPGFPPRLNEIFLRVTNDMGTYLYRIEARFFIHRWHNFLIDNASIIQHLTILTGFFLIVFLSFYFARKIEIQSPSIMHIIEEEGRPSTIGQYMIRVLVIFTMLNFFFIAVFNLTLEWLAIAVDAPILITAIFFYLLFWIKHHKRFSTDSFIYRIGNAGEDFYEKFIRLFYTKKGLLLALSGMLVLHMLTDIGNYIVPYLTGLKDPLYFTALGPGHTPLLGLGNGLFYSDWTMTFGLYDKLALITVYFLNIIGVLFLFAGPSILWYFAFQQKTVRFSSPALMIFFSSMVAIFLAPLLKMGRISSGQLVGVDMTTNSVFEVLKISLIGVAALCAIAAIVVLFLSAFKSAKKLLSIGSIMIIFLYFSQYIYYFFIDTTKYYIDLISSGIGYEDIILPVYFLILLTLTIVFYAGGFISFIYELLT